MTYDELVNNAQLVARVAHYGQTDKAGEPYFGHVERVARSPWMDFGPFNPLSRAMIVAAAYLHDTIEDTHVTADLLHDLGFPRRLILTVESLTRDPTGNETYADFIERVALDPYAVVVKLADLKDNLDPTRRWQPGESHRKRYLLAHDDLIARFDDWREKGSL